MQYYRASFTPEAFDHVTTLIPDPHGNWAPRRDVEALEKRIEQLKADYQKMMGERNQCLTQGAELQQRVFDLERFKSYVHNYLDSAGVPTDPTPERTKTTGCRIEGRLVWLADKAYHPNTRAESAEARAPDQCTTDALPPPGLNRSQRLAKARHGLARELPLCMTANNLDHRRVAHAIIAAIDTVLP